jgi:hypothetical protein
MNNEELARVNTLDRYQADLDDFTAHLLRIQENITMAETYRDPEFFIAARKEIHVTLGEIEQARHFVGVKRNALNTLIADVETLFDGGNIRVYRASGE